VTSSWSLFNYQDDARSNKHKVHKELRVMYRGGWRVVEVARSMPVTGCDVGLVEGLVLLPQ